MALSRDLAQRFIMAGRVRIDGQLALGPDQPVSAGAKIELEARAPFVSRGGQKLEAALDAFPVPIKGAVCADVGSSTGGFTDCLLQRGAKLVYAIDSGSGQLHWRLRNDPRVEVMERTNARTLERLPTPVSIVTADVSFISLTALLPSIVGWMSASGHIVALIKPQFEAAPAEVEEGGIVRTPRVHARVINEVIQTAKREGVGARGLLESPLKGPKGNREFFLWATKGPDSVDLEDLLAGLPELVQRD